MGYSLILGFLHLIVRNRVRNQLGRAYRMHNLGNELKRIFIIMFAALSLVSLPAWANDTVLKNAYELHQSDVQVQGRGEVIRLLRDDLKGSRHQRFIIRLDSGQTILVAHNIDLAPRVRNLKVGGLVEFYGEYEWNSKGGVVHWTHHDPGNNHVNGWLIYEGKVYQ